MKKDLDKSALGKMSSDKQIKPILDDFYNSFVTENQQWVHASGEAGYLRVEDFVRPLHGRDGRWDG